MKYVIKNCPCYNNECFIDLQCLDDDDTYCTFYDENCQDKNDCLLKQIVSECNKYKYVKGVELTDFARKEVALHILDKLEIEECEYGNIKFNGHRFYRKCKIRKV